MAFEKACSLEAPTTEAEVDESDRLHVCRTQSTRGTCRIFTRSTSFWTTTLTSDKLCWRTIFIDPLHDPSGSHSRDAAKRGKRGCANGSRPWLRSRRRPSSDVDGISQSTTEATTGTWWLENLSFIHRLKDGAQGWCGPGVCVLSEEQRPGRNETLWVNMRNCLHKCNRTQVRPATNEEAERNRDRYSTVAESYRSSS